MSQKYFFKLKLKILVNKVSQSFAVPKLSIFDVLLVVECHDWKRCRIVGSWERREESK